MPGKQARVLCPVCQEPIPPDETECENCGAFVIDEAVVRLSRALGLDRDRALKLFDAGFRHPKQLRGRDPNRVLEKGEVGLLFICTNCGGFVAGGDTKCPRCSAEFETEPEEVAPEEEDILDLVLCPVCGADNDPEFIECEICGEVLREAKKSEPVRPVPNLASEPAPTAPQVEKALESVDRFLREQETPKAAIVRPALPVTAPKPAPPKPVPPATPGPVSSKPPAAMIQALLEPIPKARPPPPTPAKPPPVVPKPPPVSNVQSSRAVVTQLKPMKPTLPKSSPRDAVLPKRVPIITPSQIPRKKVRREIPASLVISPETTGGLVVAAACGLLLAGALFQNLTSAGIAAFLVGLVAYLSVAFLRHHEAWPARTDGILLAAGVVFGVSVPLLRETTIGPPLAVGLALVAASVFAWDTRRILKGPRRILLAICSAVPLIGQGLVAAVDPTYAMTIAWFAGILAFMPWPAALAAVEISRRKSTSTLRHQIVQAEKNVQQKDYERSLKEYDRAIATARADLPGAEIPWYGKGATLILLGRYEEALQAIDTALDINPRNEVAWVNKGNAFTKLGRLMDSLRCFNAAIKVNPVFEVAWNNKGNALARLGKFEEALGCYEQALEIDPGYRGAWVNMGFVLTKLGRFEEAASCADHAIRLDAGRRAEPI
jgi:Flp pilus assembly protein TadD